MKVFETFLTVVKRNIVVALIYLVITFSLSFAMSATDNVTTVFEESRQDVCVINNDSSMLSAALYDYMAQKHNMVEIEDEIDKLQDAFYYNALDYMVRIPEGFGEAYLKDEDVQLDITAAKDSPGSIYVRNQLDAYLMTYKAYSEIYSDRDTIVEKTKETMEKNTEVITGTMESNSPDAPRFRSFFRMMPYAFISILIHIIGSVMVAFNQEQVYKRTRCSSSSPVKVSAQIVLGVALMAVAVWSVFFGLVVVIFKDELFGYSGSSYLIINSLAFVVVALALAFFVGSVSKNDSVVSVLGVSLSMIISFLGGIFVPLEVMGEGTLKISRLLPSYWYMTNLNSVVKATTFTEAMKTDFARGIYIQLSFAVAMIAIGFLAVRKRRA